MINTLPPINVRRSNKSLRQEKRIDSSLLRKRNLSLSEFENSHTRIEKRSLFDVDTPRPLIDIDNDR